MKGCAIAFTIIGTIFTVVSCIIEIPGAAEYGLGWIYGVVIFLSILFGIIGLCTLGSNHKSIFVGIMLILFSGLIGGILYLCWNPDRY